VLRKFLKILRKQKQKKVFLAEYRITDIRTYDSNIKFPFERVWLEKHWNEALDSSGHVTYRIDDSSSNMMVFNFVKGSELNNKNFIEGKWIIKDADGNINASVSGMLCLYISRKNALPDSSSLQIFLLKTPGDYKNNLQEVATFTIRK
jgi:hypothetical protein